MLNIQADNKKKLVSKQKIQDIHAQHFHTCIDDKKYQKSKKPNGSNSFLQECKGFCWEK